MSAYYMRDNHTFVKLVRDLDMALAQIRHEFDKGYTCGLLCESGDGPSRPLHAHGSEDRENFLKAARKWLQERQ